MKKYPGYYLQSIPGVAMEWAREEVRDIIRVNGSAFSLDDIAAICLIRGVIVGSTNDRLRNVVARLEGI